MTPDVSKAQSSPLLAARGLVKHFAATGWFAAAAPRVHAVNGVDLLIDPGETLGLVGESGCGKSTLARLLGCLEKPDAGRIWLDGVDITDLPERRLKPFRRRVQMVFQDPFSSLNPRLSIAASITEPLCVHGLGDRRQHRERAAALMRAVGLDPAMLDRYPHEFSGGQRQRIAIARAIALDPALLIADEPLSALDVSVQSQILNLFLQLKEERGLAYLFISHDLAVVDHVADRVAVMYLGRIVETADRAGLFTASAHPYTRALLAAQPAIQGGGKRRGDSVPGEAPNPLKPPMACAYHPRCAKAQAICRETLPDLRPAPRRPADHRVACHFPEEPPA